MDLEELADDDVAAVVALWTEAGLIRPWNDPVADFHRAVRGTTSTVLGVKSGDELIGTVMVGHDGHRGWAYFVAVRASDQRQRVGTQLMDAAEVWLRQRGAVKIQLTVRRENESVARFYEVAGYEESDVIVMSKWLTR